VALIIAINIIVLSGLVLIALTKGLERALPFFVFVMVLLPGVAQIPIPGAFTVTGQRVAIVTLAALYLISGGGSAEEPAVKTTPLKYLLMAHIVWCSISTANSIVPLDSVKKMTYEVIEYYLMYYILTRTITQVKTIHRMMGAMVFAVVAACVFGAFEAYTSWRVIGLFPFVPGRFGGDSAYVGLDRFVSTFSNYSLFGAAISFAIVEALYLLTLAKTAARKIYLWAALLIMFLNIYKLTTRGPWLALIIGFGMLLLIGNAVTRKRMAAIVVLSVAVMVIRPGVYHTIVNLYAATVDTSNPDNPKGTSYEYRYALWRVSLEALGKSPGRELWGYGLESFYHLHLRAPFSTNPEYPFESADSSWVELMVETGYVGLLIIAILLLKPAVLVFNDWRRIRKPQNYLCGILLINMAQYYFMMTNVALYAWGQTAYMLWMWIAAGMVYKHVLQREKTAGAAEAQPADGARLELVAAPGF
jgi:O-antigen ligase